MGRVADWLETFEQSKQLHEEIMQLLRSAKIETQTSPATPDDQPESDLLSLLVRWKQLTLEMDTPSLGPEASAVRQQIAELLQMNTEISKGATRVRDFIADQIRQKKKANQNVKAYKSIDSQR